MENLLYSFFFGIYPYICITIMILGSAYRLILKPYSITAKSSQFLDKTTSTWAFKGFHGGIILILMGHFVGFLTPPSWFHLIGISDAMHAEIAHISGGIFGVVAFVCMISLIYRRFSNDRIQATSSFADNMILILLFIQLALGLLTITPITDVASPADERVVLLGYYFQGIITLNFNVYENVIGLSIVTLSHIILGWTFFLLLPFTRLIHIIVTPLQYLFRTGYQIVRR